VAQVDASAEVTWNIGDEKFRSVTFSATIEAPITDAEAAATPDPVLYPSPSEVARKSDIPVVGSAAQLDAGTPNGAATLDGTGKLTGAQVPNALAFKSDLVPNGSNRVVISDRTSLGTLPATDANGNLITKVNIGDVVHQTGTQGTPHTAHVVFHDYTITDDDVMNGHWIYFYDENWTEAGISASDFGGSGTVILAADLANALANAINSSGLNVYANVTGDGQLTITSYLVGPLPGGWNFNQGFGDATYSETEGTASLPPGDYIVADLNNLGNATGYQGIGDTVDFLSGYGAPTADIGEEGNGYVDDNNGDFYHRDASGWQFVLNIKGPQGEQGIKGDQGAAGKSALRMTLGENSTSGIGSLLWKCKPPSYSVAVNQPRGICFDGKYIWITNYGSNTVIKLDAGTATVTGTYTVGTAPYGICFDGVNIWVTNSGSNTVTKITAATGAVVGTYNVGTTPMGICYDGTNIWTANSGSNNLTKLTASNGSVVGTYAMGGSVQAVCYDGTYIYTSWYNYIAKVQASSGSIAASSMFSYSGSAATTICWDGTYLWASISNHGAVIKLNTSDLSYVAEIYGATSVAGVCFDGSNIWMTDGSADHIFTIDPVTNVSRECLGYRAKCCCSDGGYVWIASDLGLVSKL
jgi:YVTN family beta-propeller protein